MIVGQIITPKPPEMLLVQWDDVIEHFAARTPDPALSDSVLPGTSSTGANGSNATGFQELENIATEFAIPVEQHVPVGAGKRKSLAQLLHDPIARRLRRDIEVQDLPSIVRDDKKAVEGAKRQARNGEQVKRGDDLTVVVEEGQPLHGLALVRMTLQLLKIARHGGFGNRESELEQFAVNARLSPCRNSLPSYDGSTGGSRR